MMQSLVCLTPLLTALRDERAPAAVDSYPWLTPPFVSEVAFSFSFFFFFSVSGACGVFEDDDVETSVRGDTSSLSCVL